MNRVKKHYIDGGAGQIHFRSIGDDKPGLPLLCLHQSPKSSLEFEYFMEIAGRKRRVIALDYPGCGMSDCPPSEDMVTIEYYADRAIDVLNALGVSQADLFGNHTGSMVALCFADRFPERANKLALISAPALTEAERAEFEGYFKPIPLDRQGTRFSTSWERVVHHAGPGMTLELMARSYMQTVQAGDAYEWGHAAAFKWGVQLGEVLARLPHEILVINPADDLEVHTARTESLIRKGAYLHRPDWGNGVLDANPGEVAEVIEGFLEG